MLRKRTAVTIDAVQRGKVLLLKREVEKDQELLNEIGRELERAQRKMRLAKTKFSA